MLHDLTMSGGVHQSFIGLLDLLLFVIKGKQKL